MFFVWWVSNGQDDLEHEGEPACYGVLRRPQCTITMPCQNSSWLVVKEFDDEQQ